MFVSLWNVYKKLINLTLYLGMPHFLKLEYPFNYNNDAIQFLYNYQQLNTTKDLGLYSSIFQAHTRYLIFISK